MIMRLAFEAFFRQLKKSLFFQQLKKSLSGG